MQGQMPVAIFLCLIAVWGTSEAVTGIFDCDSNNYQYNSCCTGVRGISASVMKKRSVSDCNMGNSFALYGCNLWVNHGCRARFYVNFDCQNMRTTSATCSSHGYTYATCPISGVVTSMYVTTKHSVSSCEYNKSFGFLGNNIWVDKGCRATFTVHYCADPKCC
ncbi:lectin ADEL-like [Lingula anatina]|uniref:Lectin ADEL-like n=1 Tax=Lingula anatina TaxID=7574 RepID=A0A1S3HCW9_LINAN|nr:lectin ADEL-like [Lingula anatina]|eukprot:XP_013383892.1 lectin ADEL-like [Lingula anatina]